MVTPVLVSAATREIDYNRDVRPILSENCFSCHGFDEKGRKGKLRLDEAESAYAERNGVIRIKPGDPAGSEVWQRINSSEADEVMPPPEAHATLTAAQKEILKAWIEQGAKYAPHWSLTPPRQPAPPAITAAMHPIDAFVRARLNDEKLRPSPEADRATLIRRLSYDLAGLPPSAQDVAAFVADPAPDAYDRLVDRLLASPHFGERMALEWLDAARYADTNGFSIDGGRHMWLWRDWVIQAFNDNLPYDRFLVDQLAGDLVPNRTEAQLIASGFQRNNMVTHEGGTIPEENLLNYNADRVKTLGEAVLGLTLACAQCHDHKFDPITQKDYFRLYAFFNTVSDKGLDGNAGVNPGPSIRARTVLRSPETPELRREIAALEADLAKPDPRVLAAWEKREQAQLAIRGRDLAVHPVKVVKVSTPNRGTGFAPEDGNRVRIGTGFAMAAFDVSTELPRLDRPITGIRAVFHPQPDLPGVGWGYGPTNTAARGVRVPPRPAKATKAAAAMPAAAEGPAKGSFMLTAMAVTADAVPGDQVNLHRLQAISRVTATSWQAANPPLGALDPRNDSGWAPDLATEGPVAFTATFAEPVRSDKTPYLTVQLNFGNGREQVPGLFELQVLSGSDDGTDLPADIVAALGTAPAQRSADVRANLWTYCAAHAPELRAKRVALANLKERLAVLTESFTTMVMDVAAQPRETFILNRGDYSQPTEKVEAGVPTTLPPLPVGASSDRLGLAQWVTMRDNPLTARVAVNRFWKILFGTGLVATAADLGSQGEWPSHPELLDWLAVEFVQSGWDVKALLRQMVRSQTYRQASVATAEALERDPQNRLLARGPRFRLPAELIRDTALHVSGLLVPRLGGPSVNPYTPGDLWREISHYGSSPATAQTFVQDHGEKLYRRSLYTYWKRTAPPPNLAAFDAPNREVCTVSRANTTTPLQALVLLNDVQFVEAARAFAERALGQPGDDAARLKWAFATCLTREPKAKELEVLAGALGRERQRYAKDPSAAEAYLRSGESPRDARLAATEHAAWAQVASLLLNLSETITRN
jgi:hypothetical protein